MRHCGFEHYFVWGFTCSSAEVRLKCNLFFVGLVCWLIGWVFPSFLPFQGNAVPLYLKVALSQATPVLVS